MYIYEPLFLVSSCVEALMAIVLLAVGIGRIKRSKLELWWPGPFQIQLGLAFAILSVLSATRAFENHPPSVYRLILSAFLGGMIVATILSAGLNKYISRRLRNLQEPPEARGPAGITRVA